MALNRRQRLLYRHTADLYKPADYSGYSGTYGNGDSATDTAKDQSFSDTPAYTGVRCYFVSAAEAAVPTPEGLLAEGNLFTFFNFYFDARQEIENTWAIKLTTPNHPNNGDYFVVQDNPKVSTGGPRRPVNQATVFTRRSPSPF